LRRVGRPRVKPGSWFSRRLFPSCIGTYWTTSKVFHAWAYTKDIGVNFIRLGRPVENGLIGSFNGTLRAASACPRSRVQGRLAPVGSAVPVASAKSASSGKRSGVFHPGSAAVGSIARRSAPGQSWSDRDAGHWRSFGKFGSSLRQGPRQSSAALLPRRALLLCQRGGAQGGSTQVTIPEWSQAAGPVPQPRAPSQG
jgi:hypothetical protein